MATLKICKIIEEALFQYKSIPTCRDLLFAKKMELECFDRFYRDLEDLDNFMLYDRILNESVNKSEAEEEGDDDKPRITKKHFKPFSLNECDFRNHYRFSKENMRKIIEIVRDDLEADKSNTKLHNQVPVDIQIMAAIRSWGMTEHPLFPAIKHGISKRNLEKICKRVAAALASKASRYIRMPVTLAEKEQVIKGFQGMADVPNVIGCLGHYTVPLKIGVYENKKQTQNEIDHFIQVQIVSDAAFKIRDLHCNPDDNQKAFKMFTQTRIKERFEQNEFRGRVLLGSAEMTQTTYLITPIIAPLTAEEQNFNKSHEATLSAVKQCIQTWHKRFGVLSSGITGSYITAKNTIVALALLHNMAIEWNDLSIS